MARLVMFVASGPISYDDTVKSEKWKTSMDLEMEAIERNDPWKLIDFPIAGKNIGLKWVYETKFNENRENDKYKARLVAKDILNSMG